jgi:hypothetical protein
MIVGVERKDDPDNRRGPDEEVVRSDAVDPKAAASGARCGN